MRWTSSKLYFLFLKIHLGLFNTLYLSADISYLPFIVNVFSFIVMAQLS